jgi:quaternary ammonium compound-resistance protein SugE
MVLLAGLLETGFALSLKRCEGFTRLGPTVLVAGFALASFGMLTLALKRLEVGPAYAVWTGIGAAGTVLAGMFWLSESVSALKVGSLLLVICGVVGLQLAGAAH